ncbi:MAG: NADH-quinone oxidoreductase subunit NuoH [Candidatus Poribacteria bacterium]|nr:NADH-quinone oxidoreductase subunit NuoH [Candidatus Poribacteria bacterium]
MDLFALAVQLGLATAKALFIVTFILTVVPLLIWAERRVSAWIQDRKGPNRVGPFGLFQPIADGVKFITKEDIIPARADRRLFILAPIVIVVPAFMAGAIIPWSAPIPVDSFIGYWTSAVDWAPNGIPFQLIDVNIGVLYFLAFGSLGVYGVILAGWAPNNKYTLLGGLRASAQMISYELTLGLSILAVVIIAGSLKVDELIAWQSENGVWLIALCPVTWLLFTIASFAETNRLPFDLAESEQELVGGYHTEYSSMKFGMFFLAEYAHMSISSALNMALFFGGWTWFGLEKFLPWWVTLFLFIGKVLFFLFVFIWVRWTFPRFRYDQLMALGWKILLPLSLANLFLVALAVGAHEIYGVPQWAALLASQAVLIVGASIVAMNRASALRAKTA